MSYFTILSKWHETTCHVARWRCPSVVVSTCPRAKCRTFQLKAGGVTESHVQTRPTVFQHAQTRPNTSKRAQARTSTSKGVSKHVQSCMRPLCLTLQFNAWLIAVPATRVTQSVRNVASLKYGIYAILCVMLIT